MRWRSVPNRRRSCAFLERRRRAATHDDVEAVAERPLGGREREIEARHEPAARTLVAYSLQHRIERNQGVAGEVHLRDETGAEAPPENREVDVRGPPCVVMVA